MTPCTHLSDRMPDVALGRARWTTEDERHLAGCPDCRAEWLLVSAGSRLGAALPVADPASTAAHALARLRRQQARSRTRGRLLVYAGLAAAAVLGLAVWAGRGGRGAAPGDLTLPAPAPIATTPPGGVDTSAPIPPRRGPDLTKPRLAAASGELPFPELDSLPAEALDSILKALDGPLAQVGSDDSSPDDSGDRELERALAGQEG
jgi:hypothetical protein